MCLSCSRDTIGCQEYQGNRTLPSNVFEDVRVPLHEFKNAFNAPLRLDHQLLDDDTPMDSDGEENVPLDSSLNSFNAPFALANDSWNEYVTYTGTQFLLRANTEWDPVFESGGYGEVDPCGLPLSALQNEVHALFAPDRFLLEDLVSELETDLWQDLKPALQLASRLLLSAPVMEYFRTIKYGKIASEKKYGRTYLIPSSDAYSQEANFEILTNLEMLSQKLVLIFAAIKPDENSDSQCHGIHYVSQEEFGERVFFRGDSSRLPPRSDHQHHYIILNQAYRDYFSNSSKRTATKDVRTCFLLATTLVHELAHAFYARNIIDGVEDYEEPFLSAEQADLAPELGCALDTQLYGAKTESIIDPIHGGYLEHWPILYTSKDDTVVYSRTHVIFPVSSSWFYLWFQEETWNMITAAPVEQQLQAFHIPRTDEGAARSSLKTGNFDWKRRRALIGKDRRMKAIEDYEEKNRIALQAELDDV
jgi:hypothetical protein